MISAIIFLVFAAAVLVVSGVILWMLWREW